MTEEQFAIKIVTDGKSRWLKRRGKRVVLANRKALRNFIRNRLWGEEFRVYRNGEPFEFGDDESTR